MRKVILLSGLLVIISILVFAFISKENKRNTVVNIKNEDEQGIQFIESNWGKALQEAKERHKLIFLDAYASWCGPCKLLKKKTFTDKEAGEFFNRNFINVAIDMEKGDGPALSEKFQVTAYPTLVIADANGNIVTYTQGYINPKQLIKFGEYGLARKK